MAKLPALYFSKEWQAIRAQQLKRQPYCVICRQINIKTRATEVDHIEAARLGGQSMNKWNLQSLCKTHHSQKTAHSPERGAYISHRPFVVIGLDGFSKPAGLLPPPDDET